MDAFGDSLGERTDGAGRIHAQGSRNDGAIGDVKIFVAEYLSQMVHDAKIGGRPHVAPAEWVGRDQCVREEPGWQWEWVAACRMGERLVAFLDGFEELQRSRDIPSKIKCPIGEVQLAIPG